MKKAICKIASVIIAGCVDGHRYHRCSNRNGSQLPGLEQYRSIFYHWI